jgi:hypothetical protein
MKTMRELQCSIRRIFKMYSKYVRRCDFHPTNKYSFAPTNTIVRTKNGDAIFCPLNDDAMWALGIFRLRGDGTGRVVRNSKGATLNYTASWFVPSLRAAKIENFHWHDLRPI